MNFLLKIVEGPNKGAEIALVEGVGITLGKSDACDIVLADPTLPEAPLTIEASAGGVTVGGSALEPFHVISSGATSFAVGPADAPWKALVWPKTEEPELQESEPAAESGKPAAPADAAAASRPQPEEAKPEKRRGFFGCLAALIVLCLILAGLCWVFREEIKPRAAAWWDRITSRESGIAGLPGTTRKDAEELAAIAERYHLSLTNRQGRAVLVGDFASRAERLTATAEAYGAQPGIELDFADGDSLKTAVADTLSLVGETQLSVADITNRVAVLKGKAADLRRALEAISADVPKIANVDCFGVVLPAVAQTPAEKASIKPGEQKNAVPKSPKIQPPRLPVCGILTTPYPCLVLQDGRRALEGAVIGNSVVVKIEADSVTLTNATGRFVWKP